MIYICQKPALDCTGCQKHPDLPTSAAEEVSKQGEMSTQIVQDSGAKPEHRVVQQEFSSSSLHATLQLYSTSHNASSSLHEEPVPSSEQGPCLPCRALAFLPSKATDRVVSSSSTFGESHRSTARPIQRTAEEEKHLRNERDESLQAEKVCGHASWCMYHRIMYHREKHPLPACYYERIASSLFFQNSEFCQETNDSSKSSHPPVSRPR
jgi:hypothetical protein